MFASTRGIYGLCSADQLPPDVYYQKPYISGLALRATWATLQPAAKRWATSKLDAAVMECTANNLPFTINVLCGDKTPSWIKGPRIDGVPIPWESAYQEAMAKLVAKLGELYGHEPLLRHIKTTGVNERGGELQLPEVITNGIHPDMLADCVVDTVELWDNAFNCQVVLPIQPRSLPREAFYSAMDRCKELFGSRLVLASHALSARWVNPYVANYYGPDRAIGFQMVSAVAGDKEYRANGGVKASQPEILRKALENGINAGASYIEVYRKDVESKSMQKVLRDAAERLSRV